MSAVQLKETTMDKNKRTLLRVVIPTPNTEEGKEECFETRRQVERLMGKNLKPVLNLLSNGLSSLTIWIFKTKPSRKAPRGFFLMLSGQIININI